MERQGQNYKKYCNNYLLGSVISQIPKHINLSLSIYTCEEVLEFDALGWFARRFLRTTTLSQGAVFMYGI